MSRANTNGTDGASEDDAAGGCGADKGGSRDTNGHDSDAEPVTVEGWLEAVSEHIDQAECEDLSELGLYSVHDGSAQMMTVPVDAEEFQDAAQVKQYYYEGDDLSLLIAVPIEI